ncbi:hypothetical protein J3E69DRAFT_192551 [Trichoderma sp. SZMC 28015]
MGGASTAYRSHNLLLPPRHCMYSTVIPTSVTVLLRLVAPSLRHFNPTRAPALLFRRAAAVHHRPHHLFFLVSFFPLVRASCSLTGLDPRTLASCSAYSYIHTHSLPPCAPSRRRRRCCCPQSLATAAASRSSPGLASPNARLISTSVPVPEPRDCLLCCGVGVCAALDEQIRKLENFCHLHCCFDSTQTATTRHASPPSSCDPKVLHPADMR